MTLVAFHRLATREFRAAADWYFQRSPATSARFRQAVDLAVLRISSDPDALPIVMQHYRSVGVKRFPYRLIFERREAKRILILAVAHTSRRPGYWRRRA